MADDSTARASSRRREHSWLDHPQRSALRQAILQIHLWTALISGIYMIVICLTGSAVVMRREFRRWWSPPRFVEVADMRLPDDALRAAISAVYAGYAIEQINETGDPRVPVGVYLSREASRIERRFDPYTGEDLGDPFPPSLQLLEWLVDVHDHLLVGQLGRQINGFGGGVLLVLTITGAVLWWPGRSRWTESLIFSPKDRGRRLLFRLHSSLGFWTFAILLIWGFTAIYFAIPLVFEGLIDSLDPNLEDLERPGERFLLTLIQGHFGRFGPLGVRFVWMSLGVVPIVLLVTGFLLWWRRRRPG